MDYSSVIKSQATVNIGTIGHVAHGKSTLVRAISTVKTFKYKSELERNITIKLGYANAKIYACKVCPRPLCYKSTGSNGPDFLTCSRCSSRMDLIKHVSFVDCPGHDILMATMLTGTCVMDAAMLLIACNEPCPQPQTLEHLFAIEIMGLSNVLIVQNKCDLVLKEHAIAHKEQIDDFVAGMQVSGCPVVPASCQLGINVDAILDFIVNGIPEPNRINGISYIDSDVSGTESKNDENKKRTSGDDNLPMHKHVSGTESKNDENKKRISGNDNISMHKHVSGTESKKNEIQLRPGSKSNQIDVDHDRATTSGTVSFDASKNKDLRVESPQSLKIDESMQNLRISDRKTTHQGLPQDHPIIKNREDPRMVIIRSFDVNKPGCPVENLQGGVIGGSLLKGILTIGDRVEIRPGNITKDHNGTFLARPYITQITSLQAEENQLSFAVPGGLIGVGTLIDPYFSRSDRLVGQVLGLVGKLPNIYQRVTVSYTLFKKIATATTVKDSKVSAIKKNEQLLLNIGSTSTGCTVIQLDESSLELDLIKPACTEQGERVALSRKIGNHWRLIGYGKVTGGLEIPPTYDNK